eukprot:CAMPEP_0170560516 /NCGR_PEP_ID=MMETSP0211-20121228/49292_1 /TAXON_ID=311385 /ORGANISM="Pseudokeronopsis sp., Strain OXSARD2" /LENGTH=42 /DNA_ID= /DNA_START= /DNA_END= /DNA_ORIENTATION=
MNAKKAKEIQQMLTSTAFIKLIGSFVEHLAKKQRPLSFSEHC